MNYTILEISAGQITVEFENNSKAKVPIPPNASLEDIDDAVSHYDPDFLVSSDSIINPDIIVGQQRTSVRKEEETTTTVGITTTTFSPLMPSVPTGRYLSGDIMLLAEYYAVNGDSRLKDAVMGNVSQYITEHSLNIDDILSNISYTYDPNDDILAQAESELSGDG